LFIIEIFGKNRCWASGGYPPDAQHLFFPNISMMNNEDRRATE